MKTVAEIAELFRVGRTTVQSWIDTGQLFAVNVSPAGAKRKMYRIDQESIDKFRTQRGTDRQASERRRTHESILVKKIHK